MVGQVEGQTQILRRVCEQDIELSGEVLQFGLFSFGRFAQYFACKQSRGCKLWGDGGVVGCLGGWSGDGCARKANRNERETEKGTPTETDQNITVPLANTSNVLLSLTTKRRPTAFMTGR